MVQLTALDDYWISACGITKQHISCVGLFELSVHGPLQADEGWWSTNIFCVTVCLGWGGRGGVTNGIMSLSFNFHGKVFSHLCEISVPSLYAQLS